MIREFELPNGNKIILVGTAHISKNSVDEVTQAIQKIKPTIVAVELCEDRYDIVKYKMKIHEENLVSHLTKGEFQYIFAYSIAKMEYEFSQLLGIPLGGEMEAAIKEGKNIGSEIILIDQNVEETLKNIWSDLSFVQKIWEPIKFLGTAFLFKIFRILKVGVKIDFEKLIDHVNADPEKFRTPLDNTLLVDRNKILAGNIYKNSTNGTILAVLGGGHISGVVNELKKLNCALVEITQHTEVKGEVVIYDHSCVVCGKGYNTVYKGILNRQPIKCECGSVYYQISINLILLKITFEMKPGNERDVKILKFLFGKKCNSL
jgi:pheromone shutdown protein TraB